MLCKLPGLRVSFPLSSDTLFQAKCRWDIFLLNSKGSGSWEERASVLDGALEDSARCRQERPGGPSSILGPGAAGRFYSFHTCQGGGRPERGVLRGIEEGAVAQREPYEGGTVEWWVGQT